MTGNPPDSGGQSGDIALPSRTLEAVRYWALRAAEQSREAGEDEAVWAAYLDRADKASDLLERRSQCPSSGAVSLSCARLRLRQTARDREDRNACTFPACAAPFRWSPQFRRLR